MRHTQATCTKQQFFQIYTVETFKNILVLRLRDIDIHETVVSIWEKDIHLNMFM